jgi:CHAT domain-containing protein/tetratricopeptide (TPR) repeat protein
MSSSWNLRWVLLGLALIGLALLLWFRLSARPVAAPQSSKKEVEKAVTPEVKIVGEVKKLEPGKPIEDELKGGLGHAYELPLQAGQYAYVVAEQKGVDVAVRLIGPDGLRIVRVDSPNGTQGPEPVHEVAEVAGTYRIEVVCEDPAAAKGSYEIRLQELRQASDTDRKRATAERRFAEASELRRKHEDQARAKYREVLPAWSELGDKDRQAETLFQIGWASRDLSDHDGAIAVFEEALPLYRELGNRTREGIVLNFLSYSRLQRGELEPALDLAGRARAIFQDLKDQGLEASALNNLGNARSTAGDLQQALDAYQEARAAAHGASNPGEEATALFGIGDVLIDQGKPELALDSLEGALQIQKSLGLLPYEANTLRRMANAYQRLERFDDSLSHLEKALKIGQALGDLRGEAVTLASIGTLKLRSGKANEAGEAYQKALALARQAKDPFNEAVGLLNMGRYFYAVHDLRQALHYHDQASDRFRAIGNRVGEASSQFGSARVLHDQGDFRTAHERLQQVLANVELLRGRSDSPDVRMAYFATKQNYYDLHIDVLMHLHEQQAEAGYEALAFDVNERRRARGLLELLAEAKAQIRSGIDPTLVTQESALQQKVNALDAELSKAATAQDAQRSSALEKQQRDLLAQLDTVHSEIRRRSPRYAALTEPVPLDLKQIRSAVLDRKTLLLVYSLGEERSFLWSIPKTGKIVTHILPARSLIEDVARQVYNGWRHRSAASETAQSHRAQWLSEMLLKPVAKELKTYRLLIIADGALQYLPFAALPDPRASPGAEGSGGLPPLVLNHEIVSLPSASVLKTLRGELWDRELAPRRVAVIADPVFSTDDPRLRRGVAGPHGPAAAAREDRDLERSIRDIGVDRLERLPYTEEEVRAIRDLVVEDQRFEALGFAASRATVMSGELKKYRVLHFATHGILNPKHPELSGLVLTQFDAQGNRQDGFLRSYEICNLDLRAELAVLSACQTGLGEDIRGEGLVGLTRSFMYAGVPRVVVSLWNVSDRDTAELMKRFYKALIKNRLAPSAALRCAQLSMRKKKELSDPYSWAAFVFQGEWNLAVASPDGGVETQPGGSAPPVKADIDLPPPTFGEPIGCPDLD